MAGQRRPQVQPLHIVERDKERLHAILPGLRLHVRRWPSGCEHDVDRMRARLRSDRFEDERHPDWIHQETSFLAHLAAGAGSQSLARPRAAARQHPVVRTAIGAVN